MSSLTEIDKGFTGKSEQDHEPYFNPEAFTQLVHARRSVRRFKSIAIPQDITRKCLEIALLAPTSSNLQCWEFYWVRSPDKKQKLAEACLSQPAATTAQELIVAVARTGTWKRNAQQMIEVFDAGPEKVPAAVRAYYQKLVPLAYGLGPFNIMGFAKKIALTITGFFRPIPREPTSKAELQIWAVKTTALACENLMLAYRAYGYDTCPMEGYDSSRIKRLLRLPSDAVITMVVGAGQRDKGGVYGPRIRFNSSLFIKEI